MIKNTIIVTLFVLINSILGFVAQVVYAKTFGASIEMDFYFRLMAMPTIVTGIAPVIFSSVVIPTIAKLVNDGLKWQNFLDGMWIIVLILSVIFSVSGFTITVMNINSIIRNDQLKLSSVATHTTFFIWLASGFQISSAFLSAILNYNKKFFMVSWTSSLPAVFSITCVFFLHDKIGIQSLSMGYFLASIVQFIIFFNYAGIKTKFIALYDIPRNQGLFKKCCLIVLSLLPFTILVPISYGLASKLEVGSVSYLGYSLSFAGFLSVAVSMGISMVSFPNIADKIAKGEELGMLIDFMKAIRFIVLFAIFFAGVITALRIPVLNFFFKHGSFSSNSVFKLSRVLSWYLFSAVFIGALNLLRVLFYSRQDFEKIAILGGLAPFLFYFTAKVLIIHFSYVGIGMASAFTYGVLFLLTLYFGKNGKIQLLSFDFILFVLKNATTVLFCVNIVNAYYAEILIRSSELFSILLSMILFFVCYLFVARFIFRLKELDEIRMTIVTKLLSLRH